MKFLSALFLGLLSGIMIYFILGLFFLQSLDQGSQVMFAGITLFGGWLLSTYLLMKDVKTTSKVWTRGSLLGAAEWLAMGFGALFLSGMAVAKASEGSTSGAELLGAGIGGGLISMFGLGFSVFGILVCLATWFIASKMHGEFQQEISRVGCPQCGELISAEATKCRFCGIEVTSKENALTATSG